MLDGIEVIEIDSSTDLDINQSNLNKSAFLKG